MMFLVAKEMFQKVSSLMLKACFATFFKPLAMTVKWMSRNLQTHLKIRGGQKVDQKINKAILIVDRKFLFHFIAIFQRPTFIILQGMIKITT